MRANPDPFDVEALERSLNDSTVRVSTIWVSFLVFGLYLVVAAGGTTDRQLLLQTPIELPILKIELSVYWFFVLAPILFVIFHFYLLLQVLLLARTAAAYDEAVEHTFPDSSDSARIRQRLANTLFAQIFAGAPRERSGLLGALLRGMAVVTLAIAPLLVLIVFEFRFLAYHSHFVTPVHRILVLVDVVAVLLLWRAALDPQRDVVWRNVFERPTRASAAAIGVSVGASLAMTFPGEWHNVFGECFGESLFVVRDTLIDREKLEKIEGDMTKRGVRQAYEGDRTHNFRGRDLACGYFIGVDLRRADFTDANLRAAKFDDAELQGAVWDRANLEGSSFASSNLQQTSFSRAQLRGANLNRARLQGAYLVNVQLQGAILGEAQLQGAILSGAQLRGAVLREAELQGADLSFASLEGADFRGAALQIADLRYAHLQGANLGPGSLQPRRPETPTDLRGAQIGQAQLQGADLTNARLQAADLTEAELQGAKLIGAQLQGTILNRTQLRRATEAKCDGAQVVEPRFDGLLDPDGKRAMYPKAWIDREVRDVPQPAKQKLQGMLQWQLIDESRDEDANKRSWLGCASKTFSNAEWEKGHAAQLGDVACNDQVGPQKFSAWALFFYWMVPGHYATDRRPQLTWRTHILARRLLGLDGKPCPGAKDLDKDIQEWLLKLADRSPEN
jgi:uncharacterized protein YjbI with pentapeptide repeats